MAGPIRILPLGGLGEIGKNMCVVERDGRIVLIDAGLMFPTAEMPGIDLVLPDFGYLRDRAGDIDAIVLTHGHEDHVGALPYLLREIGYPKVIYGGKLTVGLVRSKLEEHRLREVPIEVLEPGDRRAAGPFAIELIHMSHSIPDMRAVALHTPQGAILFTGDYKFDQTPVDGRPADMQRLAQLGAEGVLCLCGDSTNADRPGVAPSESSVGPALLRTFEGCEGRIIVTCFASNIHRVQQVIDAAAHLDRKVALLGRSMRKNFNIAANLGMASTPESIFIQPREIEDFPDNRVIVVSTGSQGEPLSALRRMAHGDHRDIELHERDTVVFSATPVPGNERAVNDTIDKIFEIGAEVVTAADAPIHASGHGWQEELKLMLNLTKPRFVLPLHGDHKRVRLHAGLAEAVGVAPKDIFRGSNGRVFEIAADGKRAGLTDERHGNGVIYVDGVDIGEPDDIALRDRRTLSADGAVIVVATVSARAHEPVADPEILFRGVPFVDDIEALLDELTDVIAGSLAESKQSAHRDAKLLEQDLHDDVAAFVYKRLKRRPMVLPVVVEV